MNFVVVGAGAWGTAFALHLSRIGNRVALVPRRGEQAGELLARRENVEYLPGVQLPDSIQITESLEDAVLDGAQVINNSWGGGPLSEGGEFDILDTALVNATQAGVFVSMSAGNAGPGLGTGDHPSTDYINVAASTTSGTLATGRVSAGENGRWRC